ncbi:MAG: hypothetical protein U0M21_06500 [Emergencia sp.]|nr:hypothetical protein [Emergencia sp.]
MNKYLSLVFLYNRAGYKKLLLLVSAIPLGFLAVFLFQIGNPYDAETQMLMERAFTGLLPVLLFIGVNLLGLLTVINGLNGRKALKATHATTGYTIRRLRMSPISSYLTMFGYYLAVILIFWGVAIASIYAIGKIGLTMAGASGIDIKLALGILRTDIGHALIPIADPTVMAFNIVAMLALAGECAKSCYLNWHNGRPSAGVILVIVPMVLVWLNLLEDTYIYMAIVMVILYGTFSFGDVISREKRPKGDPFKANKYAGIMDLDSDEFDESDYAPQVNSPVEMDGNSSQSALEQIYSVSSKAGRRKGLSRLNLIGLRRRFMPIGINLERANTLFGAWIFIGIAEHMIFLFRYITQLNLVKESMKGLSIASGVRMPYFWQLQEHTYYGYILGILIVFFVQAYWNYEYYNKKTKSVYVMKRLPDQKEYGRTIWAAPAIQALFIAALMVLHTAIDIGVYIVGTPEVAFYADYLSHIVPF